MPDAIIDGRGDGYPLKVNSDGSINTVSSGSSLPTDVEGLGKVSVGTTAVEVDFSGTTTGIIITSDPENTGNLFIGKSDVTNLGANAIDILEPGDSITIDYDDTTNAIYVVSDTASQNFYAGASL